MEKIYNYNTTVPTGVIAELAIELEGNGEKFALTTDEYLRYMEDLPILGYKKLGYVYVY